MGIGEDDFVKGFVATVSNETVIKQIKAAIVGDLKIQLNHIETLVIKGMTK